MVLRTATLSMRLLDDFERWAKNEGFTFIRKSSSTHKVTVERVGGYYTKGYIRPRKPFILEFEGPASPEVNRFLAWKFERNHELMLIPTEQDEREMRDLRLSIQQGQGGNKKSMYLAVTFPSHVIQLFYPDKPPTPPVKMTVRGNLQTRLEISLDPFAKNSVQFYKNNKQYPGGRLYFIADSLGGATREVQSYKVEQESGWRFDPRSKTLIIYGIPEPIRRACAGIPEPVQPQLAEQEEEHQEEEQEARVAVNQTQNVQSVFRPKHNLQVVQQPKAAPMEETPTTPIAPPANEPAPITKRDEFTYWEELVAAVKLVNEYKAKLPNAEIRVDETGRLRASAKLEA